MFDEPALVDPLILAGTLGAVTSKLRFTQRDEARLRAAAAGPKSARLRESGRTTDSGSARRDRLALRNSSGGVPTRSGARGDEMIDVIRLECSAGGMVEYHRPLSTTSDRLQMSPAPSTARSVLRRRTHRRRAGACRPDRRDGWTSASDDVRTVGRDNRPAEEVAGRRRSR